jgi:ABC-type polysaccharide/polyol phosphate transport system ATPase subunit
MSEATAVRPSDPVAFRLRMTGVGKRFVTRTAQPASVVETWALKDVSFDLHFGTIMGVVGLAESGRSTLLRVASRITRQTEGVVEGRGACVSLVDLIKRVDIDLTARQNLVSRRPRPPLMAGALGRITPDELALAAVEADVEPLLRTRLSDWPKASLTAFLHAAALQHGPGVLVADKVLVPTQSPYGERALDRIRTLVAQGSSVLYAGKDLAQLARLCDSVLWLEQGRVRQIGQPDEVLAQYRSATAPVRPAAPPQPQPQPRERAALLQVELRVMDDQGVRRSFTRGERIRFEVSVKLQRPGPRVRQVALDLAADRLLIARAACPPRKAGADSRLTYSAQVDSTGMAEGLYRVVVRVMADDGSDPFATQEAQVKFFVSPSPAMQDSPLPFATIDWVSEQADTRKQDMLE